MLERRLLKLRQTYEDFMMPVMQVISDGGQYRNKEIQQKAADIVGLTAEEKKEMLPSGGQNTYKSRTNWAITYLKNAGLITKIAKGLFEISESGKVLIKNPPNKINTEYLMSYPEFRQWISSDNENGEESVQEDVNIINNEETPEEQINQAIEIINKNLSDELLTEVLNNSPEFFEALVVKLLVAMGYGGIENARVVGQSGDDGIDGIINSDKLGFEKICIQAKRYGIEHKISNKDIRDFSGALLQQGVTKGVFITTSSFTTKAVNAVKAITQQKIILIDGKRLTNLMIEYNIGVSEVNHYVVKRLDTDFFDEA